jgi:hypothetical protein
VALDTMPVVVDRVTTGGRLPTLSGVVFYLENE